MTCTLEHCGAPTSDRLCPTHRDELVTALRSIATGGTDRKGVEIQGLWGDLQDVVCGRVSLGDGASVASTETEARLPVNVTASSLASALDNTIITWHNVIAEDNPHLPRTATTTAQAAAWLADLPTLVSTHEAAREIHDEITAVVREVERMVDRRPDRLYLGTCGAWLDEHDHDARLAYAIYGGSKRECDGQLYARPSAPVATCRKCEARWDVAERRAWMLDVAEDHLLTAAECCRALAGVGQPLGLSTLGMWSHRGRLTIQGHTDAGRPLYRLGDVIDLMAGQAVA